MPSPATSQVTRPSPALPARPPAWRILNVLVGITLGFGGAILYSERSASKVDDDAARIAASASPAIEHLAAARGEILRIQQEAALIIQRSTETAPMDLTSINAALSRLHREMSAYLALPFYPRERDHRIEMEQASRDLDTQLSNFLARITANDSSGAVLSLRTDLSRAASSADQAIEHLVIVNAERQHRLGIEIPMLRRTASHFGHIMEAVTAVFGMSVMVLVFRSTRRYGRLLDERRHFAEERATVAIAFSTRFECIAKATLSIANAIVSNDPQTIFRAVADETRVVAGADYCALGSGNDSARPFERWAFSGVPAAEAKAIGGPPCPVGLLGAVARDGRPLRLADLTRHPEFRGLPKHHPTMGPFLGIPLVHHDHNVGNVYLARGVGQPAFSEDDESAASVLAAYAAVAIDNSRLYNEAQAATRAREDLLAMVSHDLKNPVHAIHIATVLLHRIVGEGRADDLVVRIDRAAERMSQMIGDLLDAAKIEAGLLRAVGQPEDVTSLVNQAIETFNVVAADKAIHITPQTPQSPVAVRCERELILRVFSNVIGNAIKFSAREGMIFISAESLNGQVHFSVKDIGPGIPTDQLPRVFDRYWQQKDSDRRGSGLGLYIAKGIVEAHRGRIWAESKPGDGTTIHFTLPAHLRTDDSSSP